MNQSTNSSVEYGGLIYFFKYMSAYLPYTLLSIFAAIVGTFGKRLLFWNWKNNKILISITTKEMY